MFGVNRTPLMYEYVKMIFGCFILEYARVAARTLHFLLIQRENGEHFKNEHLFKETQVPPEQNTFQS